MSEETTQSDSQSQRWLKYGSNTVLASVVAVLLGALVIYLAQHRNHQIDTTAAGLYSLKPQTVKLIEENKQKITITSFYSKAKRADTTYGTGADAAAAEAANVLEQQAGHVSDLLDEYASRGRNITVETIDPKLNPSKADALIEQVTDQYGGEVKKYRDFTDGLGKRYDAIAATATAERARVAPLRALLPQTDEGESVAEVLASVARIPAFLKEDQAAYQAVLKQKPPDYKGVADSVSSKMTELSSFLGQVQEGFAAFRDKPTVPADIRRYMSAAGPTYQDMKKQADALIADVRGLGELKLDTIREALHQDNAILVRGDKDWKVIRYDQVWKNDSRDLRNLGTGVTPKPRFAGEQMITTAILALEQPTKTKVCFVRAGGPPLAESGGQFSSIAGRLRDYNFDVSDKDLTGQWQMQAMQQQQMPTTPEPSDADVDDAIWVVIAQEQQQQQNPMMGAPPPSTLAPKVAEHIGKGHHWADGKRLPGGCVYVLALPHGEALAESLTPFGVTIRTDAIAVHELVQSEGAASTEDRINEVEKNPVVFPIKDWGHSPITDTLAGLPGVLLQSTVIQTATAGGATNTPLIPVPAPPDGPPSWGTTSPESTQAAPKFDKATDLAGPLFAAGAAERTADGARVVVMGSTPSFIGSDSGALSGSIVDFPDPELLNKGVVAPRFPGNAEFFMNGVFWLSHQEPMIAISPAAMTVSRLAPMSRVGQGFWHVGVLLIGLPGLVVAAGVAAYLSRRD